MEQSDLSVNAAALDTLFGDMKEEEVRLHEGASSDRHLAHIFRHMAKGLFNKDVGGGVFTYRTLRNKTSRRSPLKGTERFCYALQLLMAFGTSRTWS
ncbi:Nuclear prelamin A recognition factor [Myotis brandtii]|uniref:Nuclear prelamin A recognition factor n=1 Tax=Myotis brandtii TaxID=109478 RepID=S7N0D6_MYOBR|nr:Nuclear prelamin A recognition factor [Myotis brandtii]